MSQSMSRICKTCVHWSSHCAKDPRFKLPDHGNCLFMSETYDDKPYDYRERGNGVVRDTGGWVQTYENFGCIHWEVSDERD